MQNRPSAPLPAGAVLLTADDVERAITHNDLGSDSLLADPLDNTPAGIASMNRAIVRALRAGELYAARLANGTIAFARPTGS